MLMKCYSQVIRGHQTGPLRSLAHYACCIEVQGHHCTTHAITTTTTNNNNSNNLYSLLQLYEDRPPSTDEYDW